MGWKERRRGGGSPKSPEEFVIQCRKKKLGTHRGNDAAAYGDGPSDQVKKEKEGLWARKKLGSDGRELTLDSQPSSFHRSKALSLSLSSFYYYYYYLGCC